MLKLMKYEFRKLRTVLIFMAVALVGLEAGFLAGDALDNYRLAGISLWLLTSLAFGSYVYILIAGIVSYSQELNSKTGYMTFLTPVTPMGVVASKLLFTVLTALAATALFGAAAYFDFTRVFHRLDVDPDALREFGFALSLVTRGLGASVLRVLVNVAAAVGGVLIEILLVMCTAYLAITLSATLLQNRKGLLRRLATCLFFLALAFVTSRVHGWMAWRADPETFADVARLLGAQAAVDFAFCALFAGASALLLDRRVSL